MYRFIESERRPRHITDARREHATNVDAVSKATRKRNTLVEHRRVALASFGEVFVASLHEGGPEKSIARGNYLGTSLDYDKAIVRVEGKLAVSSVKAHGSMARLQELGAEPHPSLEVSALLHMLASLGEQQLVNGDPEELLLIGSDHDRLRAIEIQRRSILDQLTGEQFHDLADIELQEGAKAVAPELFRGRVRPDYSTALVSSYANDDVSWRGLALSGDPDAIARDYLKPSKNILTDRRLVLLGYDPAEYKARYAK